jgi:hypothetical protein
VSVHKISWQINTGVFLHQPRKKNLSTLLQVEKVLLFLIFLLYNNPEGCYAFVDKQKSWFSKKFAFELNCPNDVLNFIPKVVELTV